MRVVIPEEGPLKKAPIPFKQLSEYIQKSQKEEGLKRAPIEMAPLSESTRMATKERDTVDSRLRGVMAGESMEDARKRYAKEDGKPYVPPIEQNDLGEIDLDTYLDNPEMRDFLIEDAGRTPQSVNNPSRIEGAPLDIEGEFNKTKEAPKPEVIEEIKPVTTETREDRMKEKTKLFLEGFNNRKAESPINRTSMADNAALMRVAPSMQTESAGLNSLQEQAKRFLSRRR